MTIKGPISEEMILDMQRYPGAQNADIEAVLDYVSNTVETGMDVEMGMPVSVSRDEYRVGGGLFGTGSISPALVFRNKQHSDYATIFVSFKLTGAVLEVMVAQSTPTSRNYQKTQQGKLLADKDAAQREDTYYIALCQVVAEAIQLD